MTTADEVQEKALALAQAGTPTDEAIRELLDCCAGKRVSVVLARRHVLGPGDGTDPVRGRAGELLGEVLQRLPE
jgi:hypothetical protein